MRKSAPLSGESDSNRENMYHSVRMQELAERYLADHLEGEGFFVSIPARRRGRPWSLRAKREETTDLVAEVKVKERRRFYPDVGLNREIVDRLRFHLEIRNLPVHVFIIETSSGHLLGAPLDRLETPRLIRVRGKAIKYPLEKGGVVYYPVTVFDDFGEVPPELLERIEEERESGRLKMVDPTPSLPGGVGDHPVSLFPSSSSSRKSRRLIARWKLLTSRFGIST